MGTPSGLRCFLHYLTTHFWIFRTNDGARHWQQQYEGQAEGGQTYVHFFDGQRGLAYAGISYRTDDGGAHWQGLQIPGPMGYVTFASPTLGWAEDFEVGTQHLYKTEDGGATWTRLPRDMPGAAVLEPVFEIQASPFRESGEGWLGAGFLHSPIVYLTLDGGASWQTIAIPSPQTTSAGRGYLASPRLVPGGGILVLVSDESSRVLATYFSGDRGLSWREVIFPFSITTSDDLSFVDASHWWRLRSGQVYKTSDAGRTWTQVSVSGLPDGWRYEAAHAIDGQHAWWAMVSSADSTRSALAVTSDGAAHWMTVNPAQPQ